MSKSRTREGRIVTVMCIAMLLALPHAALAAARDVPATQPLPIEARCPVPWPSTPADAPGFEQQNERIRAFLEAAEQPLDKAQARLALASLWLAVPTAEAAIAELLGIGGDQESALLHHAGTTASEHIAGAQALLAQAAPTTIPGDTSAPDATRSAELARIADELAPFAALMATFGADPGRDAAPETWARAARGLAAVREAPDATLAACARMWQAFAWTRAGRYDRAKIVLPAATATPQALPYDFVSRLLRCRILADEGQFVAASALLTQVRAACPRWLSQHDTPTIRAHDILALFLQCRVYTAWLAHGGIEGSPEARERLAHLRDALRARLADEIPTPADASPFRHAVPIRIDLPEVQAPARPAPPGAATAAAGDAGEHERY